MSETLTAVESIPMEDHGVELRDSIRRAQQLEEEVRQGHSERFPELERIVDALTQSSWFTEGERTEEWKRLYEATLQWKRAYQHLHWADERCEELRALKEGDDRWPFEDLYIHFTTLVPLQTSFTPDMTVRFEQLRIIVPRWKEINDHLYYGGEAMAAIRDHFSPPDFLKLRAQILALKESPLLYIAYPLQKQRAEALTKFWIEDVRNVYAHQTFTPASVSADDSIPQLKLKAAA